MKVDCKRVLYLPSTPLNVLVCLAHACQQQNQESVLVLIDQNTVDTHPYLEQLTCLDNSPFTQVEMLVGAVEGVSKLALRQQNFAKLETLLAQYDFDAVATGSDRRIEFQFCMNYLSRQNSTKKMEGWYLDDGLYSYAGRKTNFFKDGFNNILKKLVYGLWWSEPRQLGTSKWISKAWLFQPLKAINNIQQKPLEKIAAQWFQNTVLQRFSRALVASVVSKEAQEAIPKADVCILIPHPSNVKKMPDYAQRLTEVIQLAERQSRQIAIKYHPRFGGDDRFDLARHEHVTVIPTELAFESILLLLNESVHIIGDVGTALLTAKWLRPKIKVTAVLSNDNAFENKMRGILQAHGVHVTHDYHFLEQE